MSDAEQENEYLQDLTPDQQRQYAVEMLCYTEGKKQFEKRVDKAQRQHRSSETSAGRKLIEASLETLSVYFDAAVEKTKRGRRPLALDALQRLGADAAAYLTAKAIIDIFSAEGPAPSASALMRRIAGLFLDELNFRKFEEAAPGLYRYVRQDLNQGRGDGYAHPQRRMNAAMNYAGIEKETWDDTQRIHVGSFALNAFIKVTAYVETDSLPYSDGQRDVVIRPTNEALEWMDEWSEWKGWQCPVYLPTTIPPKPWTTLADGGYHYGLAGRFRLIKDEYEDGTRKHNVARTDSDPEMPVVYKAVNALQNTSWMINRRVFDVLQELSKYGNDELGIPGNTNEPLPPRPSVMTRFDADAKREIVEGALTPAELKQYDEAVKTWSDKAAAVRNRNHANKCERLRLWKLKGIVRILLEGPEYVSQPFYFPYQLDFRGRAYAVPVFQPQGDDMCRGLLQFGEGKPLGTQEAVNWFAISGANHLAESPDGEKLDKLPFEERVKWIDDHQEMILAAADDPIRHQWWIKADSPWQFLAWCFEWSEFIRSGRSLDFVSYLPVSVDGTCNGLQHIAALLKDEETGKAVNLLPSERPQDIYKQVAEKVKEIMLAEKSNGGQNSEHASYWLDSGKIDRSLMKAPVMTLCYGSTPYRRKWQLREKFGYDRKALLQTSDEEKSRLKYLDKVAEEALAVAAPSAMKLLDYFRQRLARFDAGKPIRWKAPSGFEVMQAYPKIDTTTRIKTQLCGAIFKPRTATVLDEIDTKRQATTLAPNVIHSLDAAHMAFLVAGTSKTISHFHVIHDSFGTHACNVEVLASAASAYFKAMHAFDYRGASRNQDYMETASNLSESGYTFEGTNEFGEDVYTHNRMPPRIAPWDSEYAIILTPKISPDDELGIRPISLLGHLVSEITNSEERFPFGGTEEDGKVLDTWKEVPAKGELDITKVTRSRYFVG